MKFGGSSLADPVSIAKAADIILGSIREGGDLTVVISAQSGVTDKLAEISMMLPSQTEECERQMRELENRHLSVVRELIPVGQQPFVMAEIMAMCNQLGEVIKGAAMVGEVTSRTNDLILSFGEQLSAWLICNVLKRNIPDVVYTDARLLIKTDSTYGNARVLFEKSFKLIKEYYRQNAGLKVVTGFIASTTDGQTTTLGRNGSDYTASILGAALDADIIEIWSDTDGVMTADPQYVEEAQNIEQLSYTEAMELSHFGAKIIFPASLQPAMAKNIPLVVKNTFNPLHKGTLICDRSIRDNGFIKGISSLRNVCLINVEGSGMVGVAGVSARIFNVLSNEKISVILISQASSEHSICIALMQDAAVTATTLLKQTFAEELESGLMSSINCETSLAIVAVVGEDMRNMPGVAARVFAPLGRNGINIKAISQGSSELNISFVIHENDLRKALSTLHQSLFKNEVRQLHLFVAGTGLVGSRLIDMVHQKNQYLIKQKIELKLCGLINSRKMLTEIAEPDRGRWRRQIESSAEKAEFGTFVNMILIRNLENSVFVDITPSDEPVTYYPKLLSSSVSIVSANKKANSGELSRYNELQSLARKRNVSFHYETNVGAGLPVINVIRNILAGGDKVLKIESVLSGTLNWLLSEYDGSVSFGKLVKKAKDMGFTEPNPYEDLSGNDVTRKCLILARECGLELELDKICSDNLIPPGITPTGDISQFFDKLEMNEQWYYKKYMDASTSGKKLRYMATVESDAVKTGLCMVDESHPFYGLKGSENCIILTTNYYRESPMVIMGPGAGADVTAAGLLADIVRIAEEIKV